LAYTLLDVPLTVFHSKPIVYPATFTYFSLKGSTMNKKTIPSMIKCFVLLILLMPAWLAWDVSPAQGAIILVNRYDDPAPGTCEVSDCSLREAIIQANSTPALDEIYLPAGEYNLTHTAGGDDQLAGDLDITNPVYIWGLGAPETVVINGNELDRVFHVTASTGIVTIESVKITGGKKLTLNGGGIACYNATLNLEYVIINLNSTTTQKGGGLSADNCTMAINNTSITNNSAGFGGGISALESSLTITNSLINLNYSASAGGGIHSSNSAINFYAVTLASNVAETTGGGVYQIGTTSSLSVDHSLVAENHANTWSGGGLQISEGTNLNIVNSTITTNVAYTYGGGVATSIPTTINHSTIVYNHADYDANNDGFGGGVFANTGIMVTISNTILARNTDHSSFHYHDCAEYGVGGQVISNGYNLVESGGNCTFNSTGEILGLDPLLGPLQDNGGWTHTFALLMGSPAIDAGNPSVTRLVLPNSDQRGPAIYRRVVNGRVDIGAFEAWLGYFLPVIFK
jgi:CSLREA domain-containing protein